MNRDRLTRRICAAIVGLAVLVFAVATIGVQVRLPVPPHTEFASFWMAGRCARDGRSPYDARALRAEADRLEIGQSTYPFVYAPAFALAMRPLAALPFARARALWMLATVAALAASLVLLRRILHEQAALLGVDTTAVALVFAAAVVTTLDSASVQGDVRVGSVGAPLLLCFTIAAWCMLRGGRPAWLLGAALAAGAFFKVTPIVLVAWVAWRGARRAAVVACALAAASAVPPLFVWGPDIYADWWRDGIAARLAGTSAWANNQSLEAVLQRLWEPQTMREQEAEPPFAPRAVAAVLGVAVIAVTLRASLRRRRARLADGAWMPVEFGVTVVALLVVVPLAWVHTLAALTFVWPVLVLGLWSRARSDAPAAHGARRAMVATAVAAFLASAHLPVLWSERFAVYPWVVATSAHLAGALGLWAVGCWALATVRASSGRA